ncbi:MAG TPA: hypothetical protein VFC00_02880 [Micromonosporaceae bacterium]|nr:hypothetical protein [Micromonosporaceae bacterium]
MGILPFRTTIETHLPPDEVARRLTEELNPPSERFGERLPLYGWVRGDTFEVYQTKNWFTANSRSLEGKGRIVPGRAGANVELTLTPPWYVWAFATVWFLFAGAFTVGIFVAYLRGSLFGQQAWPMILLLPGIGAFLFVTNFAREAARIRYHIRRILGFPRR